MVYLTAYSPTYHLVDNEVDQGVGLNFTELGSLCVKRPAEIQSVMSVVYLKALRVEHYL